MPIQLEIEGVFNVMNRGCFVIARILEPKANFYVTKKSFLGGVELAEYLDIPRSVDENGKQRNVVAFQLKYPQDAEKLIPQTIVELIPADQILFLEPWESIINSFFIFNNELAKEVSEKHILYGVKATAIAKRSDNDDVLFELTDSNDKFAIVHLTWNSTKQNDPKFPRTELFETWLELYNNRIAPDNNLFIK